MKKERKVYWKVVTLERKSCVCHRDSIEVTYPVWEWTKPKLKGSKLMVFSDRQAAINFAGSFFAMKKILKCYIKNPTKQTNLKRANSVNCDSEFINYWQDYNKNRKNLKRFFQRLYSRSGVLLYDVPKHTVFCDEVYCLE